MLFKNYWGSFGCWWTCSYLSLIFYQSAVAPNCIKSHTNSWCPDFFQKKKKKKKLSDVRSEIHLVRRNIISTRQSVRSLKKLYSDLPLFYKFWLEWRFYRYFDYSCFIIVTFFYWFYCWLRAVKCLPRLLWRQIYNSKISKFNTVLLSPKKLNNISGLNDFSSVKKKKHIISAVFIKLTFNHLKSVIHLC